MRRKEERKEERREGRRSLDAPREGLDKDDQCRWTPWIGF